jgi:long-chain fatty acid transport protein
MISRPAWPVVAAVLLAPTLARASGFLLYEQSAPALGKGSAVVASTRDPSAAWFNPAAAAYLPAWGASVSTALVFPATRFAPDQAGSDEVASRAKPAVVPSIFMHGAVSSRVQLSLAVLVPFGLVVRWPDGWVGAQQSLVTDLKVFTANPGVAVRLDERLSIAAGLSIARGLVTLAQGLPPVPGGRADLKGDAWGNFPFGVAGFNLGVLYRWRPDQLHLAATYRSRMRLDFTGDADFQTESPGLDQIFSDQRAAATITLPDVLAAGVMWRPLPRLELSFELNWVLWSTFKELKIDFSSPLTPDREIQRSSVDPLTGRLGVEWQWPALAARAGVSYDQSASRKETLAPSAPDANRLSLGAGLGWQRRWFTADVAYLYAHLFPAESTGMPPGTYRSHAHIIAVTVGVRRP